MFILMMYKLCFQMFELFHRSDKLKTLHILFGHFSIFWKSLIEIFVQIVINFV